MFQRERLGTSDPGVALQLRSSADDLEELHAREGDVETCTESQASRQGAEHAGRRVRQRGDSSRSRGETRRAVDQAGDRDWALEGATRRCEAAVARRWLERFDQAQCEVGDSRRAERPQTAVAAPVSSGHAGAEAREPQCRVAESAVTPGKNNGASSIGVCPQLIGSPRRPDKRAAGKTSRRSPRRAHTAEKEAGERLSLRLRAGGSRRQALRTSGVNSGLKLEAWSPKPPFGTRLAR